MSRASELRRNFNFQAKERKRWKHVFLLFTNETFCDDSASKLFGTSRCDALFVVGFHPILDSEIRNVTARPHRRRNTTSWKPLLLMGVFTHTTCCSLCEQSI